MPAGGSLQYVVFKKHCVTLVKSRTKMLPHPYCRRIPAAAIWDIRTGKPKAFHLVSDHAGPWTADDRITVRTGLYPCLFHHIAGGAPADVRLSMDLLPVASLQNVPLRIYGGSMSSYEMQKAIFLQIFWLVVTTFAGKMLCHLAQRRMIVQGG